MTRSLLDVSVLVALLDADHVHHERAWTWWEAVGGSGWASCAITENGFVRVISQPRYPSPLPVGQAVALLRATRAASDHRFWPCTVSVLEPAQVDVGRLHGASQVTDVYLLALAVRHGGRLVTFDRRLARSAVPGAGTEHLVVL